MEGRALVVAGFWGSSGPWSRFEEAWRSALRRNVFVLEQFHARNFLNRRAPFDKLEDGNFGRLQDDLLRSIVVAQIHPFAAGIVVEDFRSCSVEKRRWLTGAALPDIRRPGAGRPDFPYIVPFHAGLSFRPWQHRLRASSGSDPAPLSPQPRPRELTSRRRVYQGCFCPGLGEV